MRRRNGHTSVIDLIEIKDFLDERACEALRAEMCEAGGGPATVLNQDQAYAVRPQMAARPARLFQWGLASV